MSKLNVRPAGLLRKWLAGFAVLALVLGAGFVACDDGSSGGGGGGSSGGPLDGTWEMAAALVTYRITCSGDNWTQSAKGALASDFADVYKGTLKVEGKSITLTTTHQKSGSDWVEVIDGTARSGTLADDGKSFTVDGLTSPFTKK